MWASALNPTGMARRLWARFEVLPFRYGMALGAGVIVLVGVLVSAVALGGGDPGKPPTRPTVRPSQPPVEAAAPPAPIWGTYVPPRTTTATAQPARPRTAPATPRAKPKHASPRPTTSCPPTLKKWTWVWQMCRRR